MVQHLSHSWVGREAKNIIQWTILNVSTDTISGTIFQSMLAGAAPMLRT